MRFYFLLLVLSMSLFSSSVFSLSCGDTITGIVRMQEDLDCTDFNGYSALSLREDAILNGRGFRIITPNTSVGIYAEGNTIKVRNVEIQGNQDAKGVEGYNVQKLIINNVIVTDMYMGVDFYSEDYLSCDRLRISNSIVSHNVYGARVNAPSCDYTPRFVNSDFSNSGNSALSISTKKIRLLGKHNNDFSNSTHGFSLKATETIVIRDLDLSDSQVGGTQIYIYDTESVRILDSVLGNSQEGIHIYDTSNVDIRRTEVGNTDIGIKVANDKRATDLLIKKTTTSGNSIGVLVTSFDSVTFSSIDVDKQNNFDFISIQNQ